MANLRNCVLFIFSRAWKYLFWWHFWNFSLNGFYVNFAVCITSVRNTYVVIRPKKNAKNFRLQ